MGFSITHGRGGIFEIGGVSGDHKKKWSSQHESMCVNGQSKAAEQAFLKDRSDKTPGQSTAIVSKVERTSASAGGDIPSAEWNDIELAQDGRGQGIFTTQEHFDREREMLETMLVFVQKTDHGASN